MSVRSIRLFYTHGNSDKEYHATIEVVEGGYQVFGFNGRRGSSLKQQVKTPTPVDLATANKKFDSVVKEKSKEGYTTEVSGIPYSGVVENGSTEASEQIIVTHAEPSNMAVQLLNPIDEDDLESKILDPNFCLQEKYDGERRPVKSVAGIITAGNRKGFKTGLPKAVHDALANLLPVKRDFEFDCEIIGEKLYIFDCLALGDNQLHGHAYSYRLSALNLVQEEIEMRGLGEFLEVAPTAFSEVEKRDLVDRVRANSGEGVVAKDKRKEYTPGRPASGGDQLKHKFYETASCIVGQPSPVKNSVSVQLLDEQGELVEMGNVTIPPNASIPAAGEIIEVRYLYVAGQGGSLYQPTFIRPRNDIERAECTMSQLKYKQEPKKGMRP